MVSTVGTPAVAAPVHERHEAEAASRRYLCSPTASTRSRSSFSSRASAPTALSTFASPVFWVQGIAMQGAHGTGAYGSSRLPAVVESAVKVA